VRKVVHRELRRKAFRRPLSSEERAGLLKAYHVSADGYTYAEGIDLALPRFST